METGQVEHSWIPALQSEDRRLQEYSYTSIAASEGTRDIVSKITQTYTTYNIAYVHMILKIFKCVYVCMYIDKLTGREPDSGMIMLGRENTEHIFIYFHFLDFSKCSTMIYEFNYQNSSL